ncbi:acetyl-CoA carboxylase biotin carboxyl carrier protein [Fredinandcohnia sp. QZ13]|uniref:acetyl-CoA carboxylase biotin carboxyl carrier protein n=1 Tax=Fredinandcohnia sp. QZ13 TaxID=3073144 RepID=UPI002852F4AB|nr:acetyl-CoA carboxylase biotin carboxyl carrier protein [Fredinandcohnia sp. QZ13]MDR4888878.1 acetyl-CoA carboxylase biotin carboxyl carrier protein [Fredinandcohnia sp. QZ13]
MLKIQELRELIKLVDHSNIDEFTFESEGSKIKMKKNKETTVQTVVENKAQAQPVAPVVTEVPQAVAQPAQPQTQQAQPAATSPAPTVDENLHKIVSPMVGTFYASPSPDAEAYVKKGDKVKEDSVVCIVEAMKLFNEIEAEVNGEIVEILVENGQLVEYGQPLFLVKA